MIITCPSCDAQYLLPDNAIGEKGRRVKCTSCAHVWLQMPELIEIGYEDRNDSVPDTGQLAASDATTIHDSAPTTGHAARFLSRRSYFMRMAIDSCMYTLCALIVTGILLVSFADKIVAAWPQTALLYEALNIPVAPPGQGVEFRDMKIATTATATESGDVAITGVLANTSSHFVRLPALRVMALDRQDQVIKDWKIQLGGAVLSAGKEASLDYVLQDAPSGTFKIKVIFID